MSKQAEETINEDGSVTVECLDGVTLQFPSKVVARSYGYLAKYRLIPVEEE